MNSHIYKIIIAILICILPNSVVATTSIVTWAPPAGGIINTYSDCKTFTANRGDILSLKCTGTISSGSSVCVYLKVNGTNKEFLSHNSPNHPFTETSFVEIPDDGDYTISYTYKHNGGGTAYSVKIYANIISPLDDDYTYSLTNGEEFHKDGFHYKYDGSKLSVCSCKIYNYSGNMIFPSSVTYRGYDYEIGEINSSAFINCTEIQSIKFDNPSISIGEYAFKGCTNLRTVNLPLEMTHLQPGMFEGCISLSEIDIHNISDIGYSVFANCSSLKDIQFSKKLTTIGASAFTGCAITEVTLPNSLMSVGSKAFYKCPALNNIVLGNGINELGEYAFQYCTGLESVSIGKSLENIGNAFYESSNVKYLTYLEGCEKTIPTGFKNVVNINLPESLLEISDGTFSGFDKMVSVEFPTSLVRIGEGAFRGCQSLSGQLVIPSKVKSIDDVAFSGCSKISSVKLGEDVETIGDGVFQGCNITNLILNIKLQSIGASAFQGCPISSFELNEGLKNIGENAFAGCKLTSLKLPSSLQSIGDGAFSGNSLTNVELNEGLKSIGKFSFRGNYLIENLYIPNSVTSIGEGALTLGNLGQTNEIKLYRLLVGNGLEEFGPDITRSVNIGWSFPREVVFGKSIKTISDSGLLHRGSGYGLMPGAIQYLLTNNTVTFSGCPYNRTPDCIVYVADSTKYSEYDISKYKIKNICHSDKYTGEYSGIIPEINLRSELPCFKIKIDPNYFNVGSYSNVQITLSNDTITSTITIPCDYVITKAPLTITPYDVTISYGDNLPEFNCFYQGLKNNETPDYALSKLPKVTTVATKGSNAGEYKLYASDAEANNYSISYQVGTLTIKPAQQTITWNQSFDNVISSSKIELNAVSSCGLKIQYNSSEPSIAYIAEEGGKTYLYTLKDGVVVITASQSGNNNYEAATNNTKTIVVFPRMATSIGLNKTNLSIKVRENFTLTATVLPESTIDKSVVWESLDTSVATVENGVVHAVKLGETTIKATTRDGSNLSASCKVSVVPPSVTSLSLNKTSINIVKNEKYELICTALPTDATNKEIEWSSDNSNIANVDNGIVTAVSTGSTSIVATSKSNSNLSVSCRVIVSTPVTALNLDYEAMELYVEDNVQLRATCSPNDADNKMLKWSSNNEDVATVSSNGYVSTKNEGKALITATTTDGSNISASCEITIKKREQNVTWNQDLSLILNGGEMILLDANASSDLPVSFVADNNNVVSIFDLGDKVYLNPIGCGKTYISAYQQGNYKYEYTQLRKDIEVIGNVATKAKTLVVYYSQSPLIDGIVAELANQLSGLGCSVNMQKIEPTNGRINEANVNKDVRDSVMSVIGRFPNDFNSYPSINGISVNINEYDDVIMVYPLWNSNMAAPMQTFSFMNKDILRGKSLAYIEYDLFGDAGSSSNIKVLRLNTSNIDDKSDIIREWLNSEATGILQFRAINDKLSEGIYDLQGRKISKFSEHGVNIINGKKIIIR